MVLQTATAAGSVGGPYEHDLLDAATECVPALRAQAPDAESLRRLPDETIALMRGAGLLAMTKPKRFGGRQVNFRTVVEVLSELARGDGSASWIAAINNGMSWIASLFSDESQADYWADGSDPLFCGVFSNVPTIQSRKVEGGWSISGSWAFASGCLHADWALVSFPVVDDAGQVVDEGAAMVPMSEFSIKDTWFVAGMKATGSQTLVGEDVFVPEHRTLSMSQATFGHNRNEHEGEPEYRVGFAPFLTLLLVAPQIGMVRGAADIVDEALTRNRGVSYTVHVDARRSPSVQWNRAQAQRRIDTAETLMRSTASWLDRIASDGDYPDEHVRTRMKSDCTQILEYLREAIELLLNIGGAGSFADANPLQRYWRDVSTASRHAVLSPDVGREVYAHDLLGVQEMITPLV